ncbi:DNA polymerase III subunit delta' [Arcanobacterium haemolyticum]|nr:DNA polymerase III subunit delta' [Arcanobacterium haemolyticum]
MSVFDELVGQTTIRTILEKAAAASRLNDATGRALDGDAAVVGGSDAGYDAGSSAMSQAWLLTGPPGSGRSIAARMFAAALECTGPTPGCGQCHACRTVMAGTHPDVELVSTQGVTITVEQTRNLVASSYVGPGAGRWRIIIVEDADRMLERTTNVLLKAIEEPPPFTIWMLCTPAPDDVMPTIRSRCRILTLAIPDPEEIAQLLMRETGADHAQALNAARAAQSHVGAARGLLTDPQAADDRRAALSAALSIKNVGDAVFAARDVIARAEAAVATRNEGVSEAETAELTRNLGIEDGNRIPPAMRAQFRELADMQKRRETRMKRDELDRAMVNILSAYRDVLTLQLGASVDLVNADFADELEKMASSSVPAQSIRRMDAVADARGRLQGNVDPRLLLEAMFVALRPQG